MKRYSVSSRESDRILALTQRIDERAMRTILTGENERLMRPERFANIVRGTARLTEAEKDRIDLLSRNAVQIENLSKKGDTLGNREFETNRALRDWLQFGKAKGEPRPENRTKELRAIRGLRRLGYTGSLQGKGYVRKGK